LVLMNRDDRQGVQALLRLPRNWVAPASPLWLLTAQTRGPPYICPELGTMQSQKRMTQKSALKRSTNF